MQDTSLDAFWLLHLFIHMFCFLLFVTGLELPQNYMENKVEQSTRK